MVFDAYQVRDSLIVCSLDQAEEYKGYLTLLMLYRLPQPHCELLLYPNSFPFQKASIIDLAGRKMLGTLNLRLTFLTNKKNNTIEILVKEGTSVKQLFEFLRRCYLIDSESMSFTCSFSFLDLLVTQLTLPSETCLVEHTTPPQSFTWIYEYI